jgi:hypothetical protein
VDPRLPQSVRKVLRLLHPTEALRAVIPCERKSRRTEEK